MNVEKSFFSALDYIVFLSVLFLSAAVGIFYAIRERWQKNQGTDTYLMGDRQMPLIPVTLSLVVSFQSAILVLGSSSEMYFRGSTYWWSVVGISGSALMTCLVFVPVFYYLKLTSVYEYLEARFRSKMVRKLGAGFYVIVTVIYLSIAIYAPSVALNAVTPFPLWLLILLAGCVCTFYVAIGGIKAVIWTDAIQAVFMLAGLVAVAIKGTLLVGGVESVWESNRAAGRIIYFDPNLDPFVYMTSWGIIVGQIYSWLGWYGINQSSVQRYCGMKSVRQGQMALLLNIPALFMVVSLVCYCGFVMFSYYANCDPLRAGIAKDRDELLPLFVMEVLGSAPGIPGLFVACLYAGTLSSVSSGLNSLAAVVWEDFLKLPLADWSDQKATLMAKFLCFGFGVISTALSFLAPYLGGVLQAALSTMGAVNGPLTGMFLLGVTVPWANKKGAITGALVSAAFCIWLCIGAHVSNPYGEYLPTSVNACSTMYNMSEDVLTPALGRPPRMDTSYGLGKLYSVSYVLYDGIGITIVMLVAVPVSYFTGFEELKHVNPKLFHPLVRQFVSRVRGKKWKKQPTIDEVESDELINSDKDQDCKPNGEEDSEFLDEAAESDPVEMKSLTLTFQNDDSAPLT